MKNQVANLQEKRKRAEHLLDTFSNFTEYKHGIHNPYWKWLNTNPNLSVKQVVAFLCFWYPISRHQPQILLHCASAYNVWADRKLMMQNYLEEDGMVREGDDPHYMLLQMLINKLDDNFIVDETFCGDDFAEEMISEFQKTLEIMTAAEATGYVAAIEHPALDISFYFNKIIELCGRSDLLTTDLYLTIHVDVEPDHIIWAHGNALYYIENGDEEKVLAAYQKGMKIWTKFWQRAFTHLGYPYCTEMQLK